MNISDYKKISLPDAPGIYIFKRGSDILYIGKATSLQDRTRSYFAADLIQTRGMLLVDMVAKADSIEVRPTDSVLEALLLEAHLIKERQPYYNTKEKDNKSFNVVVVTKEAYPRVLAVRNRSLDVEFPAATRKYVFGPFPHGGSLKEALKLIRKIFPYRDKCIPESGKPCFNYQLGLCPGVCVGATSAADYAKIITNIKLFFEGKKSQIIKNLEKEMATSARAQEFEKANEIKRRIYALQHIQDVSLIKHDYTNAQPSERIEAYDVAHISGTNMVGVMVVLEDGEPTKSQYRKFKLDTIEGINDIASLRQILTRRLGHADWPLPQLIVVDGAIAQKNAAETVLAEHKLSIPVVAVTKNDHHKPESILADVTSDGSPLTVTPALQAHILLANNEAHRFAITYHRQRRSHGL